MGADFRCAILPAVELTPENLNALRQAAEDMTADELDWVRECHCGDSDDEATVAALVLRAVNDLPLVAQSREVALIDKERIAGCRYPVWITGGIAYGDPPTEAYSTFAVLADAVGVYEKLEELAEAS